MRMKKRKEKKKAEEIKSTQGKRNTETKMKIAEKEIKTRGRIEKMIRYQSRIWEWKKRKGRKKKEE